MEKIALRATQAAVSTGSVTGVATSTAVGPHSLEGEKGITAMGWVPTGGRLCPTRGGQHLHNLHTPQWLQQAGFYHVHHFPAAPVMTPFGSHFPNTQLCSKSGRKENIKLPSPTVSRIKDLDTFHKIYDIFTAPTTVNTEYRPLPVNRNKKKHQHYGRIQYLRTMGLI